jgi:hypothetical protein
MENSAEELKILIQKRAEKIWKRARTNAFAHRAAAERYECLSKIFFCIQLALGLSGLFVIILLYALISKDGALATGYSIMLLTLASVLYGMGGLAVSVVQNYFAFEVKQGAHNYVQHSYLYLAQRAWSVTSPCIDDEATKSRELIDLERDFQILKARGEEPRDQAFRFAHETMAGRPQGSDAPQAYSSATAEIEDPSNDGDVTRWERHACKFIIATSITLYLVSAIGTYKLFTYGYNTDKQSTPVAVMEGHPATNVAPTTIGTDE